MRIVSYIFLLILILIGITFAMLNAQSVTLNYYVGQKEMPLSLLIAASFILGCLVSMCVSILWVLKVKFQYFRTKR